MFLIHITFIIIPIIIYEWDVIYIYIYMGVWIVMLYYETNGYYTHF